MSRHRKPSRRIESLERRIALAIDVHLLEHTLLIRGDAADDAVAIRYDETHENIELTSEVGQNIYSLEVVNQITFFGGEGDDTFRNDTSLPSRAYGNAGDDILTGGGADDVLFGDHGVDSATEMSLVQLNAVRNNFGAWTAASSAGGDIDNNGAVDLRDLNLVRNYFGSAVDAAGRAEGHDNLTGGEGNDELHGEGGDDLLDGLNGHDLLFGGSEADRLLGGLGNDVLHGQNGHDALYGEEGLDTLAGDDQDDFADGGVDDDVVIGGEGNDYLIGGLGNDTLTATAGDDTLVGEENASSPFNALDVFNLGDGEVTVVGAFVPSPDATDGEGFGLAGRPHVNLEPIFVGSWSASRRQAVEHAFNIWESVLVASYASETIHVQLKHAQLGANKLQATSSSRDAVDHASYTSALANHVAHRDIHPDDAEFSISVNSNAAFTWYEGTDGNPPIGQYDFVSVMLHEVGHGLGFDDNEILSEFNTSGPCRVGQLCIEEVHRTFSQYADQIEYRPDGSPAKRLSALSPQEYQVARVSDELYWVGDNGIDQNYGGAIRMYAPDQFSDGSSVCHVDPDTTNNSVPSGSFLMYPGIGSGTVRRLSPTEVGMLEDLGWNADYSQLIDRAGDVTGLGTGMQAVTGDFDGDGDADIAIGMPNANVETVEAAGAVALLMSSRSGGAGALPVIWHQQAVTGNATPGVAEAGDHFGQVLAVGDFDHDGYDDLAIGAPSEDIADNADAGAVVVLYGSATGFQASRGIALDQNDGVAFGELQGAAEAGDLFGASLVVGDFNHDGFDDLAIGAPGEDVGSKQEAGAVNIVFGGANGLTPSGNKLIDQDGGVDFGDIRGAAEADDFFGASLAVGDFNHDGVDDLAIGAPREDIGSVVDAGAVNIVLGGLSGLTAAGNLVLDQNGSVNFGDLQGTAEAGDQFGANLAVGDFNGDGADDLVIGVPGEDVGTVANAGAVNVVVGGAAGLTASGNFLIDQDGGLGFGDIRGTAESADGFGAVLAVGDFNHDGFQDLAIGSPRENLDTNTNAGAVNMISGGASGLSPSGNFAVEQDGQLGFGDIRGVAEADDRFGSSLAVGDLNGDGWDDFIVTVPGEDIGELQDRGMINVMYSGPNGLSSEGNERWYLA